MGKPSNTPRSFWIAVLVFTFIVNLAMLCLTYSHLRELKADLTRSTWSGMLILCLVIMVMCVWFMFRDAKLPALFARLNMNALIWRILGAMIFIAILYLIPYSKFTFDIGQEVKKPVYDPILLSLFYYWMCWWLLLFAMTALKVALQTTWEGGFASALVLLGLAYEIALRFNVVTDYPLSLGWSEGSRYYYASLFFSKWIYGESFPLSTLHPTRYLLQSFPFLFSSLGLFAHRLWQFLLWVGLTAGASIALTHRVFTRSERAIKWLAAGWLFLFLLRVGVYYHLEVMVIVPLLFVSNRRPWRSLAAVIVASIWAGMSRVNWFPMPAMIAIAIHVLETPVNTSKKHASDTSPFKQIFQYLSLPILWGVAGLISALLTQIVYAYLSGNSGNANAFTSSFTSDLLWYRLLPNANFPLGVIPAILLVSGPLIVIVVFATHQWRALHPMRWLGLIIMLVALFAGSAVVSTKIGGGGDLHNMDTYAVLVGIVAFYFFSGRVQVEPGETQIQVRSTPVWVFALVIPLLFLIPALSPYPIYNEEQNQAAHQQLINMVNEAGKTGPVLFINDRQVIALGEANVPLVYDYEVVTLMEMAMSGNQAYMDKFYADLASHRFSAIVATKQNLGIKQEGVFVEENNVWNTYVSPYILCYYESTTTVEADGTRLEVYTPRIQSENCPSGNIIQ